MVQINGEATDACGQTLAEYLAHAGYRTERIAVECNGEIVPRDSYGERVLEDGDVLEVVSFVGGG